MPARRENPPDVDELYGLEPVIEPGDGEAASGDEARLRWRTVQCPYCGESFETAIDPSAGSTSYIEDCQVCCQPIEFRVKVADEGRTVRLQAGRGD